MGASHRQDREGGIGPTRKSRALSALFLVIFALTLSIVSFYLLLSLDAHWFSTMFAVLVFTDVVQTGTAFVAVVAGLLVMAGKLKGFLNEHHLHSLGKMVFASTGFWAYIYFCQYMLIWYANLPEETIYFLNRADHGWLPYLLFLPALKFVVPFLLMLPRDAKRNPRKLVPVAALLLFAQFWELYLMVGPAMGHGGGGRPCAPAARRVRGNARLPGPVHPGLRLGAGATRGGAAEGPGAHGVPGVSVVGGFRLQASGFREARGSGLQGEFAGAQGLSQEPSASPEPAVGSLKPCMGTLLWTTTRCIRPSTCSAS